MRKDDSTNLIENQNEKNIFKMTKSRTAMFLVMIIISCALIFSITEAYPTTESNTTLDSDTKVGNNSRLVITHVIKTIEFEVGLVDDDGVTNENETDTNDSEFYETDIQLLNVDLLKEIVDQASEEENKEKQMEEPTKRQEGQMANTTLERVEKSAS